MNCKCTKCGRQLTPKDVERISEQSLLAEIAISSNGPAVSMAVADKLNDQTLAQNIYAYFAMTAANSLTDKALLADVAKNAKDITVRSAAAKRLQS